MSGSQFSTGLKFINTAHIKGPARGFSCALFKTTSLICAENFWSSWWEINWRILSFKNTRTGGQSPASSSQQNLCAEKSSNPFPIIRRHQTSQPLIRTHKLFKVYTGLEILCFSIVSFMMEDTTETHWDLYRRNNTEDVIVEHLLWFISCSPVKLCPHFTGTHRLQPAIDPSTVK